MLSRALILLALLTSTSLQSVESIPVEMILNPDSNELLDAGFPSNHLQTHKGPGWQSWGYPYLSWPLNQLESRYYDSMVVYGGGFSPMMNLYLKLNHPELRDTDLLDVHESGKTPSVLLIDITPGSLTHSTTTPVDYTVEPFG